MRQSRRCLERRWSAIALVFTKAGLITTSLGPLFGWILGQWQLGGVLVVAGILSLIGVGAIHRWQRTQT